MDYEQKYKEIMELARKDYEAYKSVGDGLGVDALESIFPELRESEDEQVLKNIVATIEQCPDDFLNPKNRDRMLAWLEKQKVHHIPWYDYQKSKEAGYTIVPNEEYEQLIKQKEQKPQVFCEAKAYDLGYKQGKEDAIKEQKPAWSKEDERIMESLISLIETIGEYYISLETIDRYVAWLKSLHPVKQEWSRANENKIGRLAFLVSVAEEKEMISPSESVDLRNFIKSLRPSWKPSEEQMSSLKQARDYYMSGGIKYVGRHLSEIVEQLEKL